MRSKGTKNLNGAEPWKEYGLTKGAYYNRMCKGIPLDAVLKRGRKKSRDALEIENISRQRKMDYGRFSGEHYFNSEEKLNDIKKKYKDGITEQIMLELYVKLGGQE